MLVLGFWTNLPSARYEQLEVLGVSKDGIYEIVFVVGSSWMNTSVPAGLSDRWHNPLKCD